LGCGCRSGFIARLGWLLGERFLLLTHIGRRTGQPHQNVLEVIRHDRATGAFIVASGWEERADWFRNIQKTPEAVITVKNRRAEVSADHLSMKEAERELLNYGRRHPFAFRHLAGLIMGRRANGIEESARSISINPPCLLSAYMFGAPRSGFRKAPTGSVPRAVASGAFANG